VVVSEHPAEVDRQHVADDAAHQQLLHLGADRRVAIVEGDAHPAARALAVSRMRRHFSASMVIGFSVMHVAAEGHGAADVLVVNPSTVVTMTTSGRLSATIWSKSLAG
jgi:hypothetical protein